MSAKAVAVNTISQVIGKICSAASTFLITIYLARSLGASGYGEITKVLTFVSFFYLFADFGLNATYLQRDSESLNKTRHSLWNTLLTLRTVLSIGLIFVSLVVLVFLPSSSSQGYTNLSKIGIILFIPTVLFQGIITSVNAVFQKNLQYKYATLAVSVGSIVSLLLVYASTRIFVPQVLVFGSICAMAIGSAITAIIGLIFVKKYERLALSWNAKEMRSLFVQALPLGVMLLFDVIYFRMDSVLLTVFRSTKEVGVYGFAYKLFEFPLVIPTFFMNAMYPLMMKKQISSENNNAETILHVIDLFKKSIFVMLPLSFCVATLFWFASPLVTLVKPEFSDSVSILRILSLGLPVFFLSGVVLWTLIALKKQSTLVWIYGLSMLVNVVSNYIFIPIHGMTAAAIITVLSEIFVFVCSSLLLYKTIRL